MKMIAFTWSSQGVTEIDLILMRVAIIFFPVLVRLDIVNNQSNTFPELYSRHGVIKEVCFLQINKTEDRKWLSDFHLLADVTEKQKWKTPSSLVFRQLG